METAQTRARPPVWTGLIIPQNRFFPLHGTCGKLIMQTQWMKNYIWGNSHTPSSSSFKPWTYDIPNLAMLHELLIMNQSRRNANKWRWGLPEAISFHACHQAPDVDNYHNHMVVIIHNSVIGARHLNVLRNSFWWTMCNVRKVPGTSSCRMTYG